MFDLSIEWGYLPEGTVNPAKRIKKFREEKRDRWVKPDELPKLTKAIDDDPSPYIKGPLAGPSREIGSLQKRESFCFLVNRKWAEIETVSGAEQCCKNQLITLQSLTNPEKLSVWRSVRFVSSRTLSGFYEQVRGTVRLDTSRTCTKNRSWLTDNRVFKPCREFL